MSADGANDIWTMNGDGTGAVRATNNFLVDDTASRASGRATAPTTASPTGRPSATGSSPRRSHAAGDVGDPTWKWHGTYSVKYVEW